MEELICREGTVHSVIFQNAENGYTVLRLLTEEGEVVTVVGCIPCVAPGEHLSAVGTMETHPQHGTQLRAEVMKEMGCSDRTYTRAYGELVKSGEVVKRQIIQKDGGHSWFSYLPHCGGLDGKVAI